MANWASTSYRIEGSKTDLEKIVSIINDFHNGKRKPAEEKTDKDWEGNLLIALGAKKEDLEHNFMRGFFQEVELQDNNVLRIEAEEAWSTTDFRDVLYQLMPDLTIYFYTEEQGCEVYQTNDDCGKYFPDRYFVDAEIDGDYKSEYFTSEELANEYVAKLLNNGKTEFSEEELDKWNEEHEDDESFINVHEIESVA